MILLRLGSGRRSQSLRYRPLPLSAGDDGLLLCMYQVDDRYLRRRQEADGRPPGAGAGAQVKKAAAQLGELTGPLGIKQPGDQVEGKDLSFVSMAGKLEVKKSQTVRINLRPMLEQDGEISPGLSSKKIVLRSRISRA